MSDPHIQRLRRLDVCAVSDALDKLGLPGAVTGLSLRSAGPGGNSRIAGRAVTMGRQGDIDGIPAAVLEVARQAGKPVHDPAYRKALAASVREVKAKYAR